MNIPTVDVSAAAAVAAAVLCRTPENIYYKCMFSCFRSKAAYVHCGLRSERITFLKGGGNF